MKGRWFISISRSWNRSYRKYWNKAILANNMKCPERFSQARAAPGRTVQDTTLQLFVERLLALCLFFLHLFDFAALEGNHVAANLLFEGTSDIAILAQELFGILAPLAQTNIANRKPGAALLDQAHLQTEIDQTAFTRNTLVVHDVELGGFEGGCDLVLHDPNARAVPDHILPQLDRVGTANVEAYRGIELQRFTAGGGFRVAEHDPDFIAQLVGEDHSAVRGADRAGKLAQRLAHQTRLEANVCIAHLALDLGAGSQRGHGVNHHHIDSVAAYKGIKDLQRLLAGIGLGNQ